MFTEEIKQMTDIELVNELDRLQVFAEHRLYNESLLRFYCEELISAIKEECVNRFWDIATEKYDSDVASNDID